MTIVNLFLNPIYEQQFNAWRDVEEKAQLIKSLQYITAQCVKQVEVIRSETSIRRTGVYHRLLTI